MKFTAIVIQRNQKYRNGAPVGSEYYTLFYEVVRKSWAPWKWRQPYVVRVPVMSNEVDHEGYPLQEALEIPTLERAEACRQDLLREREPNRIDSMDVPTGV